MTDNLTLSPLQGMTVGLSNPFPTTITFFNDSDGKAIKFKPSGEIEIGEAWRENMTDAARALVEELVRVFPALIADRDARIEAQAAEIERLREALVTVRARIEDIENPFEDGTKQEHIAFEKAVDAASLIASEVLGQTE